jgi:hypothetical protein
MDTIPFPDKNEVDSFDHQGAAILTHADGVFEISNAPASCECEVRKKRGQNEHRPKRESTFERESVGTVHGSRI